MELDYRHSTQCLFQTKQLGLLLEGYVKRTSKRANAAHRGKNKEDKHTVTEENTGEGIDFDVKTCSKLGFSGC